jgi:kynureninase
MGGINYYTGQFFDLQAITAAAHEVGAYAGFDLAHAAGNVSLNLHDQQVDFACWCNYKYLNGGPGAVGGVFIHEKFLDQPAIPRLGGWWGQESSSRFLMEKGFKPAGTATGWQLSTPPLMLLAALHASLDLFDKAGIENLHAKRTKLTEYLWFILGKVTGSRGQHYFKVITPNDPDSRGAQVSLLVPGKGKLLHTNLMDKGIITDYREPDVVRLAPVPFYNTFEEVFHFGEVLSQL